MPDSRHLGWLRGRFISGLALCLSILPIGCARAHVAEPPPGPPLVQVHGPVKDLAAVRAANHIWLTWMMPTNAPRKLTVNGAIRVRVWRGEERTEPREVGDVLHLAPGATGSYSEELSPALSSGRVRPLYYSVDLVDRNGRSTGSSDYVTTIAGGPPPAVQGLSADIAGKGVLLRWAPPSAGEESEPLGVNIRRVVLFNTLTDEKQWLATHSTLEQNLVVENGEQPAHTLDDDVQYGYTYEYRAQYIARLRISNQTVLELAGPSSVPVCIHIEKFDLSDAGAKSVPVSDCP